MKMFVFEDLDKVSGNYHENGGLMVIARNREHVENLIEGDECIEITEEEWGKVRVFELSGEANPEIFVFPDAGCC
jgi:hypothetical protein